jgi:hypothetical protein
MIVVQILPAYKLFCKVVSYIQDLKCKEKWKYVFKTEATLILYTKNIRQDFFLQHSRYKY